MTWRVIDVSSETTCAVKVAFNRDFPDGLWPMTAIGLSDEYIADREISKRSFCSVEGVSGRC
jgi:hypothetical protein